MLSIKVHDQRCCTWIFSILTSPTVLFQRVSHGDGVPLHVVALIFARACLKRYGTLTLATRNIGRRFETYHPLLCHPMPSFNVISSVQRKATHGVRQEQYVLCFSVGLLSVWQQP